MISVLLAGFVVGLVMSAPIGPMAALAALRWSEGARKAAVGIAGGVCIGDAVLAVIALGALSLGETYGLEVPELWGTVLGVVVLAGCGIWLLATAKQDVKPANISGDVASALLVTLLHPGNIGAYGLMFMVWMPKIGVDVNTLGWSGAIALVLACCLGMVAGWAAFFGLVNRLVVRFGRPTVKVKRRLARGVGIVMLVMAAVLAF